MSVCRRTNLKKKQKEKEKDGESWVEKTTRTNGWNAILCLAIATVDRMWTKGGGAKQDVRCTNDSRVVGKSLLRSVWALRVAVLCFIPIRKRDDGS
jgi:hypothetical protein